MGALPGETTPPFSFCLPFPMGSTLKGKNLLLLEQILSFKSIPHFGKSEMSRGENRKTQKLFPFVKMAEKHGGVSIHLKS